MFKRVLVVGLGLIGGSLALALSENGLAEEVTGADTNDNYLAAALEKNAVQRAVDLPAAAGSDLVILATPPEAMKQVILRLASFLTPGTIVTDVASTKEEIVTWAESNLPSGVHFVGGHPMAGSEQNGFTGASSCLFHQACYVLTPTPHTHRAALKKVISLVQALGSIPVELSPREHDRAVAVVSHLPHLAAAALVNTFSTSPVREVAGPLAAGGFKDTTRIAAGKPGMWKEILFANRGELIGVLDEFLNILQAYKQALAKNDDHTLLEKLDEACKARCQLFS